MLSESTRTGSGDYGSALLPLLHARGPRARLNAIVAGGVFVALLATLLPGVSPDLPITGLLLLPVVMVSWYAGPRAGAWLGAGAVTARLSVDLLARVPYSGPSVPYWNFLIGLALFLAVARMLPVLRESLYRDRENATTDPLTSLGNRRLFGEVAAIELNRTRRYRRPLVLAYLNVDGFERFNERHGYAEGDALLVLMASVIRGCLRASDVVARIAADEFAVLLPETHAEGAQVAVDKIHEKLTAAAGQAGYPVTFSIAVVTYAEGAVSLDGLLRHADAIMSELKRAGGNAIRYEAYEHPLVTSL
jgi:diguanylate cyclase (GGDEF)-like protein